MKVGLGGRGMLVLNVLSVQRMTRRSQKLAAHYNFSEGLARLSWSPGTKNAGRAQLAERNLAKVEVLGSKPSVCSIFHFNAGIQYAKTP